MKKRLDIIVSEGIKSLVPYPPGKPIEELERELGITGSIKLASNENPLGPSKKAVKAVAKALAGLHRYPDGSCYYLKNALSEKTGMPTENIIFGNGSNEIIELLIRTLLRPGDEAVMGNPSFAVYPLVVQAAGGVAVQVPLKKDLTHDLDAMSRAVTKKTRLVFVCNPNNPTGTIVRAKELKRFLLVLPKDVIVCMDEAYFEFVNDKNFPDSLSFVKEGLPVVVLRTFSKIYGLAGLRIGYGIADAGIIDYLGRVRQPFNVNSLAQAGALAALKDTAHLVKTQKVNADGIRYLFGELKSLGYECVDTEANFFLVKVGDGRGIYDALLKKGVIVRPMNSYGLGEYIRITVGLPAENRRFIKEMKCLAGGFGAAKENFL